MRAVPRKAFLPGTPLADAYGSSPVVTHRDAHGVATSSASAPGIVGAILAHLDIRPSQRILEIGAGTGYNAASWPTWPALRGRSLPSRSIQASPPREPRHLLRPGPGT
jgi:hypothetical protein